MMMMKKKKKIAASTPTEANIIDLLVELTEDLILEIFSHLPPTSLLQFKSVSKTWYSLISNPDFLRRNTANQFDRRWLRINNPPPPPILLKLYEFAGNSRILILPLHPSDIDQPYHRQKLSPLLLQNLIDYRLEHDDDDQQPQQHQQEHEVHDDDDDDDDDKGEFRVINSCNGLLLYTNGFRKYPNPPIEKHTWYVCNPITHDYIKLPTFEQIVREQGFKIRSYAFPNIVFDPSVSLTYKVVIWLACTTIIDHETISSNLKENEHYRFYVYSSDTRSWRQSISTNQFPIPHKLSISHWRGVLCNGVLYWTAKCPTFRTNISLCYDVEKDVISTLNFPKMPLEYSYRVLLYFGECGGRLRLIETYYKEPHLQLQTGERINVFPSIFDVMEFDNNDDLWTVKYRVNIGDDQEGYYANLVRKERHSFFSVHILNLYKSKTEKPGGEEEEEVLLLSISNICIIPFNLSSNTFGNKLRNGKKKMGECFMGFMEVVRYNTITLFPPSSSS